MSYFTSLFNLHIKCIYTAGAVVVAGGGEGMYSVERQLEPQVSLFGHERRDRCNEMLLLCNISCDDGCQLSTRWDGVYVSCCCHVRASVILTYHAILFGASVYSLHTRIILMAR